MHLLPSSMQPFIVSTRYFIKVRQGSIEVYNSGEKFDESSGSSGNDLLGTVNDSGIYRVIFDCSLENPFASCEGGTFEFKLVDCGCAGGVPPLVNCDISSVTRARDAICPPTPAPTPAPTPMPTTLSPTQQPTPFPTRRPTARPTARPQPSPSCFSGEVNVETRLGGEMKTKQMKELQIGEEVLSADGRFEKVYMFGHINPEMEVEFIRIHAHGLSAPLELSLDHLLFVKTVSIVPVRASSIQVGDQLVLVVPDNESHGVVTKVETIVRRGIYAPFTKSGKLVVNGAVVSQYVTAQAYSNTVEVGWFDTPISWHWMVHAFQAGPRLYDRYVSSIASGDEEYPAYMGMFEQLRWIMMEDENVLVRYGLLPAFALPVVSVSSGMYLLEYLLEAVAMLWERD